MPRRNSNLERRMVKFAIYLFKECARAKQEGVIYLETPANNNEEIHFNYLDSIPRCIREHLEMIGLTYDVAENSDNTVITRKTRRSKVVRKVRLTDTRGRAS